MSRWDEVGSSWIQRFWVRHGLSCVNGPFWLVRAGCYSQAALSLPHSKLLYNKLHLVGRIQASSEYDGSSHQHLIISDCFVTTEKFCLYQVIKKCSTFFTDIKVISHLIARYFNPSNYRELLVYQIWQQCEFDVCTSKYLFNSIADMLNSTLCKFS